MQEIDKKGGLFYDDAWGEWNDMIAYSPAPRIRRDKVISWLRKVSFKSLLDVGCGNGEFLREVNRVIPEVSLAGADISQAVIKQNRTRMPDMEFLTLDLDNASLPKKFDVVVCMEVVEHCADYRKAIKRLAEMTDKRLFITVPCGPLFEIDRRVGHTRHFTAEEIENALKDSGFKDIKIQRWGFPFFNIYKYAINMFPNRMSESFLSSRYGLKQKIVASAVYASFKLCLPYWGYQLLAYAMR
jgi:SAM-dependent methyltransferase